jgi:hypothetical protein
VAVLDRQWMNRELNDARLAREDAEAAQEDVEDMLRELQGLRLGRQRPAFSIAAFEHAADAAT